MRRSIAVIGALLKFTLVRGRWYGLTMFPGYADCPYHSPIKVYSIEPIGSRQFILKFDNVAYALGVQDFVKRLRTLRRGRSHLVAAETEVEDRTYVIVHLNPFWLERHFPHLQPTKYFDTTGQPKDRALSLLGAYAE